jgi:hypothetical protein
MTKSANLSSRRSPTLKNYDNEKIAWLLAGVKFYGNEIEYIGDWILISVFLEDHNKISDESSKKTSLEKKLARRLVD